MSTSTAWKCLSVTEFIDQCNWQGCLPKSKTNTVKQYTSTSWQCLTTQEFFSLSNWDGRSLLADTSQVNVQPVAFDLILPTEQFWQCFNWSGEPQISQNQVIEDVKDIVDAVEEFTLNDLSQLF